ncbi:MAG: hypothetical protein K2X29_12230, partial [Candidatus Obscuribacterales bacterium]|nr:hypothetical protein [Candidatus Obscuribacterales bacterium]
EGYDKHSQVLKRALKYADNFWWGVDESRRPAVSQLKADLIQNEKLHFPATNRSVKDRDVTYDFTERPILGLNDDINMPIEITSVSCKDGSVSLTYKRANTEFTETLRQGDTIVTIKDGNEEVVESVPGRVGVTGMLMKELDECAQIKAAMVDNGYANAQMLAAYLDAIASTRTKGPDVTIEDARRNSLKALGDHLKDEYKQIERHDLEGGVELKLYSACQRIYGISLVRKSGEHSQKILLLDQYGQPIENNDEVVALLSAEISSAYLKKRMKTKASKFQMIAAYLYRLAECEHLNSQR